ncbi:hypothetical protein AB0H51_11320 [Streptomyces griseoluteus]|uniref:DUF7426 family protein n=1 Tax=Streptomyces griseoluteus TaxID=29306 RepID=UPI0033E012A4
MSENANDFQALDDFLEDYLELPMRGRDGKTRVYRIEDPSAEDGLRIERITTLAARLASGGKPGDTTVLDDDEELNLYRMCLGSSYEPMRRELGWAQFKHCALVAMYWITVGRDAALEFWKIGSQPGKAPNRETRRQASRGSSASAAANTTRSPASTSGTKAGSKRRKKAARPRT